MEQDKKLNDELREICIEFAKERKSLEAEIQYWKNGFYVLLLCIITFLIGSLIK